MRRLLRPLWFLVAVVFLFEGWLWSHLAVAIARLVDAIGMPALKARLAAWIERLPPPATLLVFLVPAILLLPVKLLGLWLMGHGAWLAALGVLALAKVVSMGVTAFIFRLTSPKLRQMAWFRWVHDRVLAGLAWAHRRIDPWKQRVRTWARETVAPHLARLRAWARSGDGGWWRRVLRLRRWLHRTAPGARRGQS
jgi:lysylphosphatidylglycerol synthetase-like protein (DUF2156 family)